MSKYAPHSGRFSQPKATFSTNCQKCLGRGHYTYECKNPRPYVSRPSRTQQLENPKLREKFKSSVEVPDEFKGKSGSGVAAQILEANEKARSKLGTENESIGKVMQNIKKRKKEQKEKSGSSKKLRRTQSVSSSSSSSDSDSSTSTSSTSSTSSSSDSSKSGR